MGWILGSQWPWPPTGTKCVTRTTVSPFCLAWLWSLLCPALILSLKMMVRWIEQPESHIFSGSLMSIEKDHLPHIQELVQNIIVSRWLWLGWGLSPKTIFLTVFQCSKRSDVAYSQKENGDTITRSVIGCEATIPNDVTIQHVLLLSFYMNPSGHIYTCKNVSTKVCFHQLLIKCELLPSIWEMVLQK